MTQVELTQPKLVIRELPVKAGQDWLRFLDGENR